MVISGIKPDKIEHYTVATFNSRLKAMKKNGYGASIYVDTDYRDPVSKSMLIGYFISLVEKTDADGNRRDVLQFEPAKEAKEFMDQYYKQDDGPASKIRTGYLLTDGAYLMTTGRGGRCAMVIRCYPNRVTETVEPVAGEAVPL